MSGSSTEFLAEQVAKAIDYCRKEFDISYAETIGVLYLVIHDLCNEMMDIDGDNAEGYNQSPFRTDE